MNWMLTVAAFLNVELGWVPFILAGVLVVAGLAGDGVRALVRRVRAAIAPEVAAPVEHPNAPGAVTVDREVTS